MPRKAPSSPAGLREVVSEGLRTVGGSAPAINQAWSSALVLPFPPSLNRYYRTWKGRVLISSEGRKYKNAVALAAKAQQAVKLEGPLCVRLEFYRPWRRGDGDNLLKAAWDSLNGIAWSDDSQILDFEAHLYVDKENPRVEVNYWESGRNEMKPKRRVKK